VTVPDWIEHFEPFSAVHAATVVLSALLWLLLTRTALRLRGGAREGAWRRGLAGVLLGVWLAVNCPQLLPAYYVASENLPLHPCDLVGLLAPYAIWTRRRLAYAVLYFWGIGFTLQAILTPELSDGPGSPWFWAFWLPHAAIFGAAVYIVVVEGFVPTWRDCLRAYQVALLYLALLVPFNLATGFNYGYLGRANPRTASLLDLFGPWPWRLIVLAALTALGFVLLQLPWALRARRDPLSTELDDRRQHP
jgi:hypothetical integral membrane protein (TIGR02206 family)